MSARGFPWSWRRRAQPAAADGSGGSTPEPGSREHSLTKLEAVWNPPRNPFMRVFAPVNNKIVGVRLMVTAFAFLLLGGVEALLMRTQLIVPNNDFLDPVLYNQLFTMHGSTMMYLFAVPFLEGLAMYVVPGMLGARDMAFPRLSAFGYWIYLFGGLMFYASVFAGMMPDTGWFAYTPLSSSEYAVSKAQDLWLIGLSLTELSGIAAGVEIIVTVLKLRSPGMSLTRMPIFVWAMLVTGFAMTFAFTALFLASLLLELQRSFGLPFFDPEKGGDPLLWQHLFWIFGHPEVYIMFIPATGIVSTLVATLARRPLAAYRLIVLALLVTGFVSFGLWVHHMFTTGVPELAASFFTATSFIIALATGTQFFAWIATLWGTRPAMNVPMLYMIGFVVVFMLGGVTGVMVASVPFDWQAHDTFFVVAHFHYVLIGGMVLPALGGITYWFPKFSGRMMSERLGKVIFWLIFVAFNVTFFPMHIMGLLGMPRRVYTYQAGTGLEGYNLVSTLGSYALALGFALFVVNVFVSLARGRPAGRNPWQAPTLEWASASPTPSYSPATPEIVRGAYPLWQDPERGPEPDEEALREAVSAFDQAPTGWRAGLVTSTFGGEPRGGHFYPGPSLSPVCAALGVLLLALALFFTSTPLALIGFAVLLPALFFWVWPGKWQRERVWETDRLLDPQGQRPYPGGGEVGLMGAALLVTVVSVVGLLLIFTYLYLVGFAGPDEAPELLLSGWGAGALLLGMISMAFSSSRQLAGRGGFAAGAVITLLLGLAYLGLQGYSLLNMGLAPAESAYAASFVTLSGFTLLAVFVGVLLLAGCLVRFARGLLNGSQAAPLANTRLYWQSLSALSVLAFAILYLVPLL